jgi:hypothetical protein
MWHLPLLIVIVACCLWTFHNFLTPKIAAPHNHSHHFTPGSCLVPSRQNCTFTPGSQMLSGKKNPGSGERHATQTRVVFASTCSVLQKNRSVWRIWQSLRPTWSAILMTMYFAQMSSCDIGCEITHEEYEISMCAKKSSSKTSRAFYTWSLVFGPPSTVVLNVASYPVVFNYVIFSQCCDQFSCGDEY